jgi:hypothetical protein
MPVVPFAFAWSLDVCIGAQMPVRLPDPNPSRRVPVPNWAELYSNLGRDGARPGRHLLRLPLAVPTEWRPGRRPFKLKCRHVTLPALPWALPASPGPAPRARTGQPQ